MLVCGNRDEMANRSWSAPARHWTDRPHIIAAHDDLASGSWVGINDYGVTAAVMNRTDSLGPQVGKRSRGELVLESLEHAEAIVAAQAMLDIEPRSYRTFTLFIGDASSACLILHRSEQEDIQFQQLESGLHMLTASELNDASDTRIQRFLPRFRRATDPDPETGQWDEWQQLLACRETEDGGAPQEAMNFQLQSGFGTRCSHCIAIPRDRTQHDPVFLFAAGPPHKSDFTPVELT